MKFPPLSHNIHCEHTTFNRERRADGTYDIGWA